MDIAIVSPSPKPFAVGGIEKLMLGLYSKIDEMTNHRVELFKIPTMENDFWSLLQSYETFYHLDLDHFDLIITCKYPAWMVQHKNHIVYMAHHLRGLFDTYHFLNMPEVFKKTPYEKINDLIDYIDDSSSLLKDLNYFFEMIKRIKIEQHKYPQEYFAFPGPFIRKIIHFLDRWALHPSRISRYTAISRTVAKRKDYFPENEAVDVIYPPTSLKNMREGNYKYFLVVGRLDGPKRVQLVIEAMKHVKADVDLLIAGSGPEETKLKELAKFDQRIKFIGYINNKQLVDLYADALAVIYVPYDEDYGLVTIEAMHCRKPVITCIDSGGTNEFVIHEETGLIADNNARSLGKQMDILANAPDYAEKLGAAAKKFVSEITWDHCIQKLLANPISKDRMTVPQRNRRKMVVLSTYPVFPRKHGGQLRIFNLYKNIDHEFDITILSFTKEGQGYHKVEGSFQEICIPMSQKHIEKEWEIEKEIGIPVTDVAMQFLSNLSPEFHDTFENVAAHSDYLVASHPYLFHLIKPYVGAKKIIYDSHNVEYELKKSMFPNNRTARKLLRDLFALEKEACQSSDFVFACSTDDINKLKDLYGIDDSKISLVPNGVDLDSNPFTSFNDRLVRKKELGLEMEQTVVFIGSWHKPNLEAVEEIIKFAPTLPDVKFIIMGGQCLAFKERKVANNIVFAGMVKESLKRFIYSIADIAINPMITGSGTNLKVAEYMANGVPVISTLIGTRGYNLTNQQEVVLSAIEDFPKKITELVNDRRMRESLAIKARLYIESSFSWKTIAKNAQNGIDSA